MFTTAAGLITTLGKALDENRLEERLKALTSPSCWSSMRSSTSRSTGKGANLHCSSRLFKKGLILLTSNQSFGGWGDVCGDTVIASVILDRLLYHGVTITIKGDSYRLKKKRRTGSSAPAATPEPAE